MKVKELKNKIKAKATKPNSKPNELAGKAANYLGFINAAIETVQNVKNIVNR
jgi:hypothetical protein